MESNQVIGKEITDRLNNGMEANKIRVSVLANNHEETKFGKGSTASIDWDSDLQEEDIDYLESWFRLQMKKLRRMCKSSE